MSDFYLKSVLSKKLSVAEAVQAFDDCSYLFVLDSTCGRPDFDARYSFLTADPLAICRIDDVSVGDRPFQTIRSWQTRMPSMPNDAPPFCGGVGGLMSYEIGQAFEVLPRPANDHFQTPVLLAGLYDWALVWDHLVDQLTVWVLNISEAEASLQPNAQLQERRDWILERLPSEGKRSKVDSLVTQVPLEHSLQETEPGLVSGDEVSQVEVDWESVFKPTEYLEAVQRVIDYIGAGDIFQANLSQQLTGDWSGSAVDLFAGVRALNPAPFCGLLTAPDFSVVSASPERFLRVDSAGRVESRPIKGTRRRQLSPVADLLVGEELKSSIKDRAENVMIVDLLRNDISRVCEVGSVKVTGVCELEVFETVQHLVSTVVGQLRADCDVWDLCSASLPGGSITGAPKIRAMEIIAELEPVVRGAYCGNLFYCGPDGDFDSSILIRTFTLKDGRVQFPVGGGVVSDSNPADEYQETLHKASGMLRVLNAARKNAQSLTNRQS